MTFPVLSKGDILSFRHGTEIIKQVSYDTRYGQIVTNKNIHSTSNILKMIDEGTITVKKPAEK